MPYLSHSFAHIHDASSAEIIPSCEEVFATVYTDHDPGSTYLDPAGTEAWLLSASVEIRQDKAVFAADLAESTDGEGMVQVVLRRDRETGKVHLVVTGEHSGLVIEDACLGTVS